MFGASAGWVDMRRAERTTAAEALDAFAPNASPGQPLLFSRFGGPIDVLVGSGSHQRGTQPSGIQRAPSSSTFHGIRWSSSSGSGALIGVEEAARTQPTQGLSDRRCPLLLE